MLTQAQGQLILKLIDVVAGEAGLNENEEYARLREDIGRYVVEGRGPTKVEFDMLSAKADELANSGDTTFQAAHEDPAQHVAPAYLKSDVLRAPAQNLNAAAGNDVPAPRSHALFDPYALENHRVTSEQVAAKQGKAITRHVGTAGEFSPEQVKLRARQEVGEMTVAKAGATAPMIGKDARPQNAIEAEKLARTGDASTGGAPVAADSPMVRTDDERGGGQGQGGDSDIDWEGTSVKDLRSYLDEQGVEYPERAHKPELVELARRTYAEKASKPEGVQDTGSQTADGGGKQIRNEG